jgi:hypothetical protein
VSFQDAKAQVLRRGVSINHKFRQKEIARLPRHRWLMLIILATWEAEIGRILVHSQPRQIVCETPHLQNN